MAQSPINRPLYLIYNGLGGNEIREKGAGELAKTNWPNLRCFGACIHYQDIDFNKIGGDGAQKLAAANWPHLEKLDLRIFCSLYRKQLYWEKRSSRNSNC